MNLIDRYFELVQNYRGKLDDLNAYFDPRFAELEQFKDSQAYGWKREELDKAYSGELAKIRDLYSGAFASVCQDIEKALNSRPVVAPTADQLALLQAFQLREQIGREELVRAANAMRGCSAAEEAVVELAHKHGHNLGIDRDMTGDQAAAVLNTLRRSAERLTGRLSRTDATRQYSQSGDWSMFRISRCPEDVVDCARQFGACSEPEKFVALLEVPE